MRKVSCILLAVVAFLGLQAAANSATLQAGWYVDIETVGFSWYTPGDPVTNMANGYFSTPVGTYGPFQLTDPGAEGTPYPVPNISRLITVPNTVQAGASDSLALPFTMGYVAGYKWASMDFLCSTDYDPSQMYASLWQVMTDGTDVCLWSQMQGGVLNGGSLDTPQPVLSQNYYFLVTVVPEPSGLAALAAGFCAAAFWALRRSKAGRLVTMALLLAAIGGPAFASLNTSDLIVLYNSAGPNDYYDWSVSKNIADAYCQSRQIPALQEIGVWWEHAGEFIKPADFVKFILNDSPGHPGLLSQLAQRGGFDVNNPCAPASDVTKCVLCVFGVPLTITGAPGEKLGSVDEAIATAFSTTPWGDTLMGDYWTGGYANPYLRAYNAQNPPPTDFGQFRASPANTIPIPFPGFTIVRMFDQSHAIAGGDHGVLYTGVTSDGTNWTWTPVPDTAKQFIASPITDIFVLDSTHAWLCTAAGSMIGTTDGGAIAVSGTCSRNG